MLDADLLKTFVAIVECGSFTAAAARVHRTTSAVSMQIKRLEEQVGQPVLRRGVQGVELTAHGELVLLHARRILNAHAEALEAVAEARSGEVVRIGVPEEFARRLLTPLLAEFPPDNPRVTLSIVCDPSLTLVRRLEEGALDIAVLTERQVGDERGEPIQGEVGHWVCAEGMQPHRDRPLRFACYAEGCSYRQAALEILAAAAIPHRIAVVSSHVDALQAAVLAGSVVGILPTSAVLPGMRLLTEAEGFAPLPPVVLRLRHARRRPSPAAERVAEFLRRAAGLAPAQPTGVAVLGISSQ